MNEQEGILFICPWRYHFYQQFIVLLSHLSSMAAVDNKGTNLLKLNNKGFLQFNPLNYRHYRPKVKNIVMHQKIVTVSSIFMNLMSQLVLSYVIYTVLVN